MKENTYIIPAIKFYILKEPRNLSKVEKREALSDATVCCEFNKIIEEANTILIPFSEVDGLTVSEMASSLSIRNYFAIVAIHEYERKILTPAGMTLDKNFRFLDTRIFSITEDKKDVPVDQMFETYIKDIYPSASNKQKRIYHSFLEQYRYQDYEQTKMIIKEIKENRK